MSFKEFYWSKYLLNFTQEQRYVPLLEMGEFLVVNFDCMFERDYTLRGKDELLFLLHQHGKDKKIIFLTEDGVSLSLSGADRLIQNAISVLGLTQDTCAVICREDLVVPNATVIKYHSVEMWCRTLYNTIKDIPIPTGPFSKKFAAWYHRGTPYRSMLAQHLLEHHADESYISYQETGIVVDYKFSSYFAKETAWANTNTPIIYDNLFPNRVYNHEMIVGANRKPYNDYFMEIVVETNIVDLSWITEKTIKNLYIGKPFLVFGAPNTLKELRSLGFLTYGNFINEEYDSIDNSFDRLQAIKTEINRIANYTTEELTVMNEQLQDIFEHNRQQFIEYRNKHEKDATSW